MEGLVENLIEKSVIVLSKCYAYEYISIAEFEAYLNASEQIRLIPPEAKRIYRENASSYESNQYFLRSFLMPINSAMKIIKDIEVRVNRILLAGEIEIDGKKVKLSEPKHIRCSRCDDILILSCSPNIKIDNQKDKLSKTLECGHRICEYKCKKYMQLNNIKNCPECGQDMQLLSNP